MMKLSRLLTVENYTTFCQLRKIRFQKSDPVRKSLVHAYPEPVNVLQKPQLQNENNDNEFEIQRSYTSVIVTRDNLSEVEREPYFPPTFNLASYVNKSETLQQLIKLGVDLHSIEKRKGLPQFVLKLDFERDMKSHLLFLHDIGLPSDSLGHFITKNPLIFKENIEDLQTRINYLESKNFQREQITHIVEKNPFWLMFSTQRIDKRLGFFQKSFYLSGVEIRKVAVNQPKLITYQLEHMKKNTFSIKEEMGFSKQETRELLLTKPRLWMIDQEGLLERFDFVHRTMNIPHELIVKNPDVLMSRLHRIKTRHEFLKFLGKDQYDPKLELYVSLKTLVSGTDNEFVLNVAESNIARYEAFLRTL